jgi:KUP system potassium uptake protein
MSQSSNLIPRDNPPKTASVGNVVPNSASSVQDPPKVEEEFGHATSLWQRMQQSIGTVYGDIGTSVLYTIMEITRETILLKHHGRSDEEVVAMLASGGQLLESNEILGGLSLVFWALIFLTVKYDILIMRADNRGEGGTFALWSLLKGYTGKVFAMSGIGFLDVCAAGLLAADGIITPPISMLGAFEPLSTFGELWPVLITLACLFALFKVQWRGTGHVGQLFGLFMVFVWFPWIALKGLPWILSSPEVFSAMNPLFALRFLMGFPSIGALVILGVVVLAITGGEAKYADIGHFSRIRQETAQDGFSLPPEDSGRKPVMMSWFMIVLPSLLVCYAGQSAYLLQKGVPPRGNTFYAITPSFEISWLDQFIHGADMFIAAIAAFIASQALITGMFSIVKQAIGLGFMPRFLVKYTSAEGEGQVYIPAVNWALFVGCVIVTLMFRNAGNLAAAYGVAVTGTMGITTIAFAAVAFYRWNWVLWKVLTITFPILIVDLTFFGSNLIKIASGGFFPMLVASLLIAVMMTWQWGRTMISNAFYDFGVRDGKKIEWLVSLREMLDDLEITLRENLPAARQLIQGRRRLVESDRAAVFLCSRPILSEEDYVPVALRVFLKKYGVLPSHIVLLHIQQESIAKLGKQNRYSVKRLGNDIDSVTVKYGYMEQPDVRKALHELKRRGLLKVAAERWIVEVGEEELILSADLGPLQRMRVSFFGWILRLSTPAHKYLGLVYDAAISKEIIPVVFDGNSAKIALPELEVVSYEVPSGVPKEAAALPRSDYRADG